MGFYLVQKKRGTVKVPLEGLIINYSSLRFFGFDLLKSLRFFLKSPGR
jgi:hypothetical protein